MPHQRFKIQDLSQLNAEIGRLGLSIPLASSNFSILGEPLAIGGRTAPNRFVVQPMEGFDTDSNGTPQELSFRRYQRYAAGGSGIIWFEACAVVKEGRSNPAQFYICKENADTFRQLVNKTRQAARSAGNAEPLLILQLTHSGRYSKPYGIPEPLIAHRSPILDPKHNLPDNYPVVTDTYLDELPEKFVLAAQLAAEAGFDGVDVKSCHRYLFSELLASHTRQGKYGGNLENRSRLLLETLAAIKKRVVPIFITTRLNAYDAIPYPYGFGVDKNDFNLFDLREPLEVVQRLRELGISLLNISIGNPYYNPHYGRPFDFPIKGFTVPDEYPLAAIDRFITITRTIQKANPDLPVVGGGYAWLRQFLPHVAAALLQNGDATLIGQGRGSFAYPDAVKDILNNGAMDPDKCCVSCSACTQIMRDGGRTGCVVRDAEIYGPNYRLGRRLSYDRLLEEARRCRNCEHATCTRACPAGVDIPRFIKAFADNDINLAYQTIKQANVLPEMCAYICPTEAQCQGACLENIFCLNPIAIADIQRMVAQTARMKDLTALRLPDKTSGKNVAIVGGGPTGLAAAIRLLEKGHSVTLFESRSRLGGTPEGLIPGLRLRGEDAIAEINAILKPALESQRAAIHYGRTLGVDLALKGLIKDHHAVLLAVGLTGGGSGLLPAGDSLSGVYDALTFLAEVKKGALKSISGRVAVLGAGNTAMDAGSAALKLGAADVSVIYRRSFAEMPAWKGELDHYLELGGNFITLSQPIAYTSADGKLTGLRLSRTQLGDADASGRRRPVVIAGTENTVPFDIVIEAIGQALSEPLRQELIACNIKLNYQGLIEVDSSFATSRSAVFSAGDAISGGTTAVQGIAEGMRAAEAIDKIICN